MTLDLSQIRSQFPSLDRPAIFLDNPGGTQIARPSLDRINRYLLECNANHEGAFATSKDSDAVLDEAHRAMADFYNASSPEQIVFGNNMTTLTLHISRSLGRRLGAGDGILVTRLDHDGNSSHRAGHWHQGHTFRLTHWVTQRIVHRHLLLPIFQRVDFDKAWSTAGSRLIIAEAAEPA